MSISPDRLTQSMQFRVLAAASAVMLLFSVLAVLVLVKVFAYTLESGVKARLEASLYGVMGVADVLDGALWLPPALPEASFNQLTSGVYAWVQQSQVAVMPSDASIAPAQSSALNDQVSVVWRSESSLGQSLPVVDYLPSGEFSWQSQRLGDQLVWVLSFSSTWSLTGDETGYFQFSLAQAQKPFLAQVAAFQQRLILSFGVLALLLCCIQWFLLRRGLRPLALLAGQLVDIEAGSRTEVDGKFPLELRPMVKNLNATIQSERQQRERYRHTLADLAHSLKTPLTIMKNTLRMDVSNNLPDGASSGAHQSEVDGVEVMLEQVNRMDSIVQYQLKRSVAQGSSTTTQRTEILPILEKILGAMDKVYRDRGVQVVLHGREQSLGVQVLMEEADVFEILGNLIDNAFKYGRKRVVVSLNVRGREFDVRLEDDGPGIPESHRETVLARGKRLDEQGIAGQGIGMAVVADICRVYGVNLTIDESASLGGARVTVAFSYFQRAV